MTVSKTFRWEGAHRLPWHGGLCKSNHGHSYRMEVAVEGEQDARGMVLDFQEIKRALAPLVEAWDHATLIAHDDQEYLEVAQRLGWKHYVLPYDTTAENVARYAADALCRDGADALAACGAREVRVRVHETATSYAEYARRV